MPKVKKSTITSSRGTVPAWIFECPGCGCMHYADERWQFNENVDAPTFKPSILVSGTRMTEKGKSDYEAWCAAGHPKRTEPFDSEPNVCHSYVTDGRIQYLDDCTHELKGQTVELPEWEGELTD